jgi:hypothetical protein
MTVDSLSEAQAYQIVCLDYQEAHLYAEVIQVVKTRQICWVRPLLLSISSTSQLSTSIESIESNLPSDTSTSYDLRETADLLWPLILFRIALDIEVIPLLAQLQSRETHDNTAFGAVNTHLAARQQLHQFIHQVWQAYPEVF